jgi:prepilin-type N-terminal cleavage/methylation domain-containing protein
MNHRKQGEISGRLRPPADGGMGGASMAMGFDNNILLGGFIMSAKNSYGMKCRKDGFALIEIIIVIMILGIMVGVTGTLFSGMVTFFESADDHSIARRRAQDVFNIMKVPALNAGLGIPSENMDWYFDLDGPKAPVSGWGGPVEMVGNGTFANTGNALRVIYAIDSGARNGNDEITDFSTKLPAGSGAYARSYVGGPVKMTLADAPVSEPSMGGLGLIPGGGAGTSLDVRSFVTFPGLHKSPVYADSYNSGTRELSLSGKTPYAASDDILWRNVIHPNSEMHLVRAGVAYVDSESRFCFADVTSSDYRLDMLPKGANVWNGFVVEGIKAVRFEQDADGRSITVTVVAEGDNFVASRRSEANLNSLRSKWPGVSFEDEIYYEEFAMTWRTRNLIGSNI